MESSTTPSKLALLLVLLAAFAAGGASVWLWRAPAPAPGAQHFSGAAPSPPPQGVAESAGTVSPEATGGFAGERAGCHLGAVVAREAVDVAAEIAGVVARVDVRVGDGVAVGTPLAALDTRELRHALEVEQAQLRQAEAEARRYAVEASQAEGEYKRRQALEGLVSREEQEAARLRHEQAVATSEAGNAEHAGVRARIAEIEDRLARSVLRAPFAGRVAQRYLDPGARVEAGTPLVRLLGDERRLVRFALPPDQLPKLQAGVRVRVETVEPRVVLHAQVDHIAPEIDPESLLVFVEAGIEGEAPAGLPLGAEAWVALPAEASCLPNSR